ncbi:hypothetical protein SOV_07600 [Sporomusa ovata DSM 2662]|uniref:hypothetical protein n=1 Tax=Sporomusa ovata TaxID=2378 RepID=UPI0003883DAA|nr:hypothetical protein [Sporomusa ovata]EQB28414.1 hypothetical protein SOV_1c00980 [Sporomusa ovata DSM 2662]
MSKKRWDKPVVRELDVLMTETVYNSFDDFINALYAAYGPKITHAEESDWRAKNSYLS